jgi:predicted PurR-regulated permease PerM
VSDARLETLASHEGIRAVAPSQARRLARFVAVAGILVAFTATVYWSLLLPLAVSAFLTYLLLPFVDLLERRRVPRGVAVPAIVALALGVLGFGLVRLFPVLYAQAALLVDLIPRAVSTVLETWLPVAEQYVTGLGIGSADEVHRMISGTSLIGRLDTQLQAGLAGLWATGTRVAGGLVNILLIPVLTFFLLKDYPRLARGVRDLIPRDLVPPVRTMAKKIDATLRTVLKGQVTVAGILAILYVVGLSVVGLKSAVAIGVVAGICRIIPYLDVIVGSVLSTVILLSDFQGWGQVLGVVVVFLVVQGIDGAFVTPTVLGERIGLHPMIVIVSVIAFANWLGFAGVLIAVPVVAILKVVLETVTPYYLASKAYTPE